MQAKWGSHGDYQVIALSPWSSQEMYDLTLRAFNLSEQYRTPALVMADESIGHLRETIQIPSKVEVLDRKKEKGSAPFDINGKDGVPPMASFGEGERLSVTGSTHDGYGFRKTDDPEVQARLVERINKKILNHRQSIIEVEDYSFDDAEVAVIAYGFTARTSLYAVKRLRKAGHKVGLLRFKTLWPFRDAAVAEVGKKVKKIMVPDGRGVGTGRARRQRRPAGSRPRSAARALPVSTTCRRTRPALRRRIERRMGVHALDTIAEYAAFVRQNPHELDLLFKEMLIGVTGFFRDPPVWQALKDVALPELLARQAPGTQLRAWVAGCSTGEEAYSLAMVAPSGLTRARYSPPAESEKLAVQPCARHAAILA